MYDKYIPTAKLQLQHRYLYEPTLQPPKIPAGFLSGSATDIDKVRNFLGADRMPGMFKGLTAITGATRAS